MVIPDLLNRSCSSHGNPRDQIAAELEEITPVGLILFLLQETRRGQSSAGRRDVD
jgi:hypothetical protein